MHLDLLQLLHFNYESETWKWQSAEVAIANRMRKLLIRFNGQKCPWSWKYPQQGPHYLSIEENFNFSMLVLLLCLHVSYFLPVLSVIICLSNSWGNSEVEIWVLFILHPPETIGWKSSDNPERHREGIAILRMHIVSSNYCSCALQEKPWDLLNACEANILAILHYSSGNINRNFLDT